MSLQSPNIYQKVASAGIIAKNLNKDQIIADYNGSTFMLPASTQKSLPL